MTIEEFIKARLAEDEALAEAAAARSAEWRASEDGAVCGGPFTGPFYEGGEEMALNTIVYPEGWPLTPEAEHIARRDPARSLLEVKAWRHVVKCLAGLEEDIIAEFGSILLPFRDERTLSNLGPIAAIWADHPDYQEAWKP